MPQIASDRSGWPLKSGQLWSLSTLCRALHCGEDLGVFWPAARSVECLVGELNQSASKPCKLCKAGLICMVALTLAVSEVYRFRRTLEALNTAGETFCYILELLRFTSTQVTTGSAQIAQIAREVGRSACRLDPPHKLESLQPQLQKPSSRSEVQVTLTFEVLRAVCRSLNAEKRAQLLEENQRFIQATMEHQNAGNLNAAAQYVINPAHFMLPDCISCSPCAHAMHACTFRVQSDGGYGRGTKRELFRQNWITIS